MEIKELQRNWDSFGTTDPLWAILTVPNKRHNKWDQDEFFATGVTEIALASASLVMWNGRLPATRSATFGFDASVAYVLVT